MDDLEKEVTVGKYLELLNIARRRSEDDLTKIKKVLHDAAQRDAHNTAIPEALRRFETQRVQEAQKPQGTTSKVRLRRAAVLIAVISTAVLCACLLHSNTM